MSKLKELLKQSREGVKPWEKISQDSLMKIAPYIDEECVRDAIKLLDELSTERIKIEKESAWNGEATDSIHFQQEKIATLLKLSSNASRSDIVKGLKSQFWRTRYWVASILSEYGDKSVLPQLKEALSQETHELSKCALSEAIVVCS